MKKRNIREKERVKADDGTMLIKKRWTEYFERLLNAEKEREPVIIAI